MELLRREWARRAVQRVEAGREGLKALRERRRAAKEAAAGTRGVEESLWPTALSGGKALATSLTLVTFALAVTLDDLHLFRVPVIYVGVLASVVVFAAAPPFLAFRTLSRAAVDRPEAMGPYVEAVYIQRRLWLGLSAVLFVVWLILFSAGRTPRW